MLYLTLKENTGSAKAIEHWWLSWTDVLDSAGLKTNSQPFREKSGQVGPFFRGC